MKILRVLVTPNTNGLLLGNPGFGRKSIVKFGAYLYKYICY